MAGIYEHACLAIAATKSSSGNGSLFCETPDFELVTYGSDKRHPAASSPVTKSIILISTPGALQISSLC